MLLAERTSTSIPELMKFTLGQVLAYSMALASISETSTTEDAEPVTGLGGRNSTPEEIEAFARKLRLPGTQEHGEDC